MDQQEMYRAVRYFIDCINATGGCVRTAQGDAPKADLTWTDLGYAYMVACNALGVPPQVEDENEESA